MNILLQVLNAANDLDTFLEVIEDNFPLAVEKITARIPVTEADVVVANNPQGAIPEIGIGGRTLNSHLVFVSIDVKFPNLKDFLPIRLERTLAHEFHHCMRLNTIGYGKTLLEALISEGLADHFVVEIMGKEPNPWSTALAPDQLRIYLERAKAEFMNEKYNHQSWFFGRGNTDIPRWAGYALGFHLVKEYLTKHPDKKPSQLYSMKAEEFI
jgi:hypothetical protein